jgi:hypothetical protein
MRATMISTEGAQTARIRDLTSSGAGIACDRPPEKGADVILKRGDVFIAAKVVWSDGKSAGLEFYREVPLEEVTGLFETAGSCN